MSDIKVLNDEELEAINGGFDFQFYDSSFTETTKVKELTDKYPWIVTLYPDLETAAKYGLSVAQACSFTGVSYEQLQSLLSDFESKYSSDGTPLSDSASI